MSVKAKAWVYFDRIVAEAAPLGVHTNPWLMSEGALEYRPDYDTLVKLLGVPLHLHATTQTGVPALALDVWLSYELRRAGFDQDAVWPRPTHPRILPRPIAHLLAASPRRLRKEILDVVTKKGAVAGVTASSATILGKNYLKQVDVIITDWQTGPELLISTKRMDSSYGKNAANRVEESYGDAKNLRLRHPLAALGFVFGLRSDILQKEPEVAEWLADLLAKLGREDDAYHATCLIMIEYSGVVDPATAETDDEDRLASAGLADSEDELEPQPTEIPPIDVSALNLLPVVSIRHDAIPEALSPARFLATMIRRVLEATPVTMHREARARIRDAATGSIE